ncbi:MAG: helix-turn-helix transcriptional regulator, partial [Rhizobium pusense]|nr:helix-turn-helix transcriptional regulator [Agrobacterium pusense]
MVDEGDRNDRRRARTRRALLDAARRVIGRQGVENVTIQEITDEADVGFGSFYNHFATKEDL